MLQATPQTLTKLILGTAAAAAILFLVWYFSSIIFYILVSAVLAIIGCPLVCRISRIRIRNWQVPRWMGALVTLVIIWMVFATICSLFIPLVSTKLYQLATLDFPSVIQSIETPIDKAQNYLNTLFAMPESKFSLLESIASALRSIVDQSTIGSAFSSVVSLALSSVITFFSISFMTFFFLKDDDLFYNMVTGMFPSRYEENVTHALDSITLLLGRYFRGIITESALLMTAVSLVMIAFGMQVQDALFIGLIMGIMNVVPYAGPLIGGLMSVFMGVVNPIEGMTVGHTMTVIACSLLVIKGCDDFILQPTLYSERVKAHPLEIFIVILIAGSMAGIVGMLLAIPSYTVIRVFAKEFFSQYSLVKKLTDQI